VNRPNVLLVCTDQQRPDWHSTVGGPADTPTVERLADRGVEFTDATCPTPVCNPSRSCLASGREYDRCGVPNNEVDYPGQRGTLYRRLRDEAGYHVAGCGKFDLTASYGLGDDGVPGDEWGFSDARFTPAKNETVARVRAAGGAPQGLYTSYLAERGLLDAHVEDYAQRSGDDALVDGKLVATFPTELPDEAYYDEWIARQGRELVASAPGDRPWFVQVNFQNPHDPWDVTERMHDDVRDRDVPPPTAPGDRVDEETHRDVRRNYTAMVEHLDGCLADLVDAVEARDELDETLVVFCSDHGEMLGDHGQWQKDSPLGPSVGVPLVVAGPGVTDREQVDDPVTILDLHATVLEHAGLDPGDVDSRSMRPFLTGDGDLPRDVVYSGLSAWRMVTDGRYKLVRGYDSDRRRGSEYEPRGVEPAEVTRLLSGRRPVLYDREEGERENVAVDNPSVVDRLTERLEEIRGRPEDDGYGWGIPDVPDGG
jgi:arylsulfatase A-like enzyme